MADTRQAIIELGDKLLREKGYNAFSYADISGQLAIKNAAIHYYFPSKTNLVAAIVDEHLQRFITFKESVLAKKASDQVTRFLDTYSQTQEQGMICIVGTMAGNWGSADEDIKNRMKEFTDAILQWLTAVLKQGKDNGEFHFSDSPETKALLIVTNMLAAVQLMRITGPKTFQTVKKGVLEGLRK